MGLIPVIKRRESDIREMLYDALALMWSSLDTAVDQTRSCECRVEQAPLVCGFSFTGLFVQDNWICRHFERCL